MTVTFAWLQPYGIEDREKRFGVRLHVPGRG